MLVQVFLEGVWRDSAQIPDVAWQAIEDLGSFDLEAIFSYCLNGMWRGGLDLWDDTVSSSPVRCVGGYPHIWYQSFQNFPYIYGHVTFVAPLQ